MATKTPSTNPVLKAFSSNVEVVDGERAVMATITTNAVDRDGEVVIPQGVNSKEYEANPVLFFNHAWADWGGEATDKLPVGKCVGLTRETDALVAKFVFATRPESHPEGEEWLPDTLFALYQQGVMNAFSIGFTPTEIRPATDRDIEKFGAGCRRVISKSKLFEVSCVPLPCNQEAVMMAVSKGLLTQERADKMLAMKTAEHVADVVVAGAMTINDAREADEVAADAEPSPEAMEAIAAAAVDAAPVLAPVKHLKYVIDMTDQVATKSLADEVSNEIAKRRGRVYYV